MHSIFQQMTHQPVFVLYIVAKEDPANVLYAQSSGLSIFMKPSTKSIYKHCLRFYKIKAPFLFKQLDNEIKELLPLFNVSNFHDYYFS